MELKHNQPNSDIRWENIPQYASVILDFPKLLELFFHFLINEYQVQKGVYISLEHGEPRIGALAEKTKSGEMAFDHFLDDLGFTIDDYVSISIINQVIESQSTYVVSSPSGVLFTDRHNHRNHPQPCIVCQPIVIKNDCAGVIYLECEHNPCEFTSGWLNSLKSMVFELGSLLANLTRIKNYEKRPTLFTNKFDTTEKEINHAAEIKNSLFRNIGQEIRAPLISILGICELYKKKGSRSDGNLETSRYIKNIQISAKNLFEISTNLIDLVKLESDQTSQNKELIKIKLLVQGIFHLLKEKALNKGIQLTFTFNDNIPTTIYSNRSRLNLILMNLVRYTINMSSEDTGGITIYVASTGACIEFEIRNFPVGSDAVTDLPNTNPVRNSRRMNPDLVDRTHISELALAESVLGNLGGSIRFKTGDEWDIAIVLSIPIQADHETSRLPDLSIPPVRLDRLKGTSDQLLASVGSQMSADFEKLTSIPIYKGGTLRSLVKEMIKNDSKSDAGFKIILNKIEEAIFEGNALRLKKLAETALKNSQSSTVS